MAMDSGTPFIYISTPPETVLSIGITAEDVCGRVFSPRAVTGTYRTVNKFISGHSFLGTF